MFVSAYYVYTFQAISYFFFSESDAPRYLHSFPTRRSSDLTGAVATAIILSDWGETGKETVLWTRSSLPLTVTLKRDGDSWLPSLRGEGRIVFEGEIRDLD